MFEKIFDRKIWSKSVWSSTKRKPVCQGPIFIKKGKKVVFTFQHFVKPEQIIEDYVRANIYNKPRLVKINKKETPKSVLSSNDDRTASSVDAHRYKFKQHSNCEKTELHLDVVERRVPRWRLNKSTESVSRKVKRPTRVTATHSFLYEFDPFGNSKSDTSNVKPVLQSSFNIGQGDSSQKSLNVKQNSSNGQLHSTAALPKLQSRCDSAPNKLEKQEDATVYNKNTNLPMIKKQEARADQGLTMDRAEKRRRNPISEVDRDIEKVKSNWRTLRNSGFTRGRNLVPGSRSKQLYETLDKMTREIDKIQKSYLDPKSNQYLQRIATKALSDSQSPFEQKVDKIKNVLFPKGNLHEKFINKKIIDEISNNGSNNTLKNITMKGTYASKQLETRSLLSDTRTQNLKNACKSGDSLSSNFKKGNLNEVPLKSTKQMSSDIERYLEDYISDAEKNFMNKEDLKPKELFSSSEDVAEMLKRLNIQSFDMYDIANDNDDNENNSPLESVERIKNYTIKNTGVDNSTQAIINGEARSVEIMNEPNVKYSFAKKDDRLIRDNNVSCFDTSIQTGTESAVKDNPFLEMGLHALDTSLPQNALSRVLRSEYLRKDASLKPM